MWRPMLMGHHIRQGACIGRRPASAAGGQKSMTTCVSQTHAIQTSKGANGIGANQRLKLYPNSQWRPQGFRVNDHRRDRNRDLKWLTRDDNCRNPTHLPGRCFQAGGRLDGPTRNLPNNCIRRGLSRTNSHLWCRRDPSNYSPWSYCCVLHRWRLSDLHQ